ncbi:MAG TPA: tetratricopeptide repeat protein [Polyangiaceae bacterium]|nr:tetratricopeptide repeat protein [Polyangiaceae bacterium]
MIDDELSDLPKAALRDYTGDARVERVWQRLSSDLSNHPARARTGLLWAPALGLCLFLGGVFVGRGTANESAPLPQAAAESRPLAGPSRPPALPPAVTLEEPKAPPLVSRARQAPARVASIGTAAFSQGLEASALTAQHGSNVAAPTGPPEWQRLADLGDFVAARRALEASGGLDGALRSASPEQLMSLADLTRASGGREQAVRALRRLVAAFPGAPEAPLAAWTLGNLLEQGGDQAGAGEAYALYRRLSPAGDFAEDAAARQVDTALLRRDRELAARLVEQYAKDFPNGPRLGEFREELGKLQSELLDGGAPEHVPEPAVDLAPFAPVTP